MYVNLSMKYTQNIKINFNTEKISTKKNKCTDTKIILGEKD